MRRVMRCACAALVAACSAAPGADMPRPARSERPPAAAPTTRLILPATRAPGDLDCADLADRDAARAVLGADPRDPHHLDADRDGIACERLRAR